MLPGKPQEATKNFRAEIQKWFRWYFGRNKFFKGHYEINWPLPIAKNKGVWIYCLVDFWTKQILCLLAKLLCLLWTHKHNVVLYQYKMGHKFQKRNVNYSPSCLQAVSRKTLGCTQVTFETHIRYAFLLVMCTNHLDNTPYPSALDFWKFKFEKSSFPNWIFKLQKSISKLIFCRLHRQ